MPHKGRLAAGLALLALTLAAARSARAQDPAEPADSLSEARPPGDGGAEEPDAADRFALDIAGGTHFPVSIGGEATLEVPGRLLLQLHVGWFPPGYLQLINDVAQGLGWYDQPTARSIAAALDDAVVVRPALGWRPIASAGFELYLGYTLATLGGRSTKGDVTGRQFRGSDDPVSLSGRAHAIHAVIGWRWLPHEHIVIRAGLGYTKILAAGISVGGDNIPRRDRIERELENVIEKYVQTAEVRLTGGARF